MTAFVPVCDPICEDSAEQVLRGPAKGDTLCFDGEAWRVTRRHGWYYPVPDPHLGVIKPSCPRCGGKLDPATGRHIDDEGQVMDYREDLIQCRPSFPESAFEQTPQRKALLAGCSLKEWIRRSEAGETAKSVPRARYDGLDMVTPPDDASDPS